MKKRCFLLALVLALALALAACSGGEIISETTGARAYSLSCDRLTDTREATVSVGDSAAATLTASISRGRGSLSVRISGSDGAEVYAGNGIASSTSFTLLLEGPADYTVALSCDGFTGSVDLTWETVGAGVANADAPEGADANDVTITNTAPGPAPASGEIPDWNGTFENAGTGVSIALAWADNNTVEFQLSGLGSVVTATARIDGQTPSKAVYSYGEETTLTFTLSGGALTVEQAGTCSLVPDDISGTYTQTAG